MGATIRQHNGSWHVFVHHNGQRAHRPFPSKKAAETARLLIAAKLLGAQLSGAVQPTPHAVLAAVTPAEPPPPPPPSVTFQDYVEKTYLPKIEHQLKPSTYGDYDSALKVHLLPDLGELPITEITRRRVKSLAIGLRGKGLRAKTVRKVVNVLSVILSEALEDELITAHPAEKMKRHYRSNDLRDAVTPITPPDRAAVAAILEKARTHAITRKGKVEHPYSGCVDFILFLARTGCRLGEALAVRWGDVDFVTRTVRIQYNWVRRRLTTPKNHQQRSIDLSAQLVAALKARFDRVSRPVVGLTVDTEAELAEYRGDVLDRYVFGDGITPMDGDNFRARIWEPLCVVAKVGKIRIHDLRHSYASQLIAAGKELHYVQQQCGHQSPAFTLSVYGHLFPDAVRQNVDCLDDCASVSVAHPDAPRRTQAKKRHSA